MRHLRVRTPAARCAGSPDKIARVSYPPTPPPPPGGYPPPPPGGQPPPYPGHGYGGYPPQPHYQPPPPIDPKRLRPNRNWYWLSALPAIAGTILAIFFVVQFIDDLDPDIDNFQTNRATTVDVQSGDRAIYVQTVDNNRALQLPPGGLRCNVSFVGSDPQPVALERVSGSTLEVNSDSYSAEFKFDAPQDGPYRVICEGPEGIPLAVAPHLSFGLFFPLVVAICAFLLGIAITAVMEIVTAVRRSNHKQRLQREAREAQAAGGGPYS